MEILYRSTNRDSPLASFTDALLSGQAPDGGLYMPTAFPRLARKDISALEGKPYADVAFAALHPFLHHSLEDSVLRRLVNESYTFEVPLEPVDEHSFILRLDRGPTASFKDFAARIMARLMHHLSRKEGRELTVVVATSGDTGGAVASAFHNLSGVKVEVLFPKKGVSPLQRKQMTALGGNVRALAVDGTFDDCQALVKRAFSDKTLSSLKLTSANSINIGRLLPQACYHAYACTRLHAKNLLVSIPSGNFGNLMGGIIAREMGFPISTFVVAVNANDEFPRFLASGRYAPVVPSRSCSSNAMDIGHPSNLVRIVDFYGGWMKDERNAEGRITRKGIIKKLPNLGRMRSELPSFSISDAESDEAIRSFYKERRMLLEPHGAVGWCALERYRRTHPLNTAVCLETADPAKFSEHMEHLLGFAPPLPPSMKGLGAMKEEVEEIPNKYGSFKRVLLS